MYIPAVPYTPFNAAYIEKQKESFFKGMPPPDYPPTEGEGAFIGVGKPEDIMHPTGLKAMVLIVEAVA